MSRDLSVLHPELKQKITELAESCLKEGLKIGIAETWRSVEEQDELYAQGRTKPGNIVTYARGSSYSSMHQWYIAFDFYRNDGRGAYSNDDGFFSKIGAIGEKLGLEWGGRWTSPVDMPHFQLPYWGSTADRLKQLYKTPEEFRKSWEEEEMSGNNEIRYSKAEDMPEWARDTIDKIIKNNAIADKENMDLSEDMLRVMVIMDRLYSAES